MLTHDTVWWAIDRLAAAFGYSTSGLAKKAGLDATSFNKSKRFAPDGKPRWPSTESIACILAATGATMSDFLSIAEGDPRIRSAFKKKPGSVPLIGFAQAGSEGYFDEDGYPSGDAWDEIYFPNTEPSATQGNTFALEVSGDSMLPLYRNRDLLVVSTTTRLGKGDRVVVRTIEGEVMAKELVRKTTSKIELKSLNTLHPNRTLPLKSVSWIARILWVSQ